MGSKRAVFPALAIGLILLIAQARAGIGAKTSLNVSKTATGAYDRYVEWDITKTVDPTLAELFVGEAADFNYEVHVTQSPGYIDIATVSGVITIDNYECNDTNSAEKMAYISYVDDALESRASGKWAEFQRQTIVAEPFELCGSLDIPYSFEFLPIEGQSEYRNVVYVGLANHPRGPREYLYRVSFQIPSEPTLHSGDVHVTDTLYPGLDEWLSAPATFDYTLTFACESAGEFQYPNTASVTNADGNVLDEANASVTVICNDNEPPPSSSS